MANKLKALGLALVAVFALSAAVGASAASAATFHSNVDKTFGTAFQIGTNVFDTEIGNVKCKQIGGTGTIEGTSVTSVTVSPTYGECTAFGLEAAVDMNGCDYVGTAAGTGSVDIDCSKGTEIQITVVPTSLVCTLDVKGGQNIATTFTNEGASPTRDIKVTPSPTAPINYTVTYPKGETEGKCGKAGAHTDGKYTGSITVKGYKDALHKEQADVWYE